MRAAVVLPLSRAAYLRPVELAERADAGDDADVSRALSVSREAFRQAAGWMRGEAVFATIENT